MAYNKNVVEETLLQIKNLEDVLQENAKGILQSTMKEEIRQLVKESLKEEDQNKKTKDVNNLNNQNDFEEDDNSEENFDLENDDSEEDDSEEDNSQEDNSEDYDFEEDDMLDNEDEMMSLPSSPNSVNKPVDMTKAPTDELLKVFTAMGDNDSIIVKKENNMIDVKDGEREYIIKLNESDDLIYAGYDDDGKDFEEDFEEDFEDELEENYDLEDDFEEDDFEEDGEDDKGYVYEIMMDNNKDDDEYLYEIETETDPNKAAPENNRSIMSQDLKELSDYDFDSEEEERDYLEDVKRQEDLFMEEAIKKSMKSKGVGIGKGPKSFKYGKTTDYPTTKQKEAFSGKIKAMNTGKPKFEFDDEVNMDGYSEKPRKNVKKSETKEASRTLGSGKYWGREGLPKPKAAPRHLRKESISEEIDLLKEKNEEYKRALDVFRNKINEVAIFNSNLAYATRLFTEHSTTKQEKINILRRFDSVETLKESKSLYKTIKDELGTTTKGGEKTLKESFERNVNKTPSTGSATNLIESKTYENPQFMRMKDLMIKLK